MNFTYDGYLQLINLLKDKKYKFCNYINCDEYDKSDKSVIFRHDIDTSLYKALQLAKLEYENNVASTFFILLSTNFYNVFSRESNEIIKNIISLGHKIGLHFDEKRYEINNINELEYYVKRECNVIETAIEQEINIVSMHRPSKWILENDIKFDTLINSYSKKYLSDYKYLSDSRMHWREDVLNTIDCEKYYKLHILTHPFWYSYDDETINEKLNNYISEARIDRYYNLKDNFKDIEEIIQFVPTINKLII